MAAAAKDKTGGDHAADDQTDDTAAQAPATKRYKVIVTRLNRIVDGELQPKKFGDTLELDPEHADTKRWLSIRPPAIISLDDDDTEPASAPRGSLDATPPGPPAGATLPAGSQGTPIEANDQGVPLQ